MSPEFQDRLIALETQFAFQQRTIEDLNTALIDTLKTQRRLERTVNELTGKLDRLSFAADRQAGSRDPDQTLMDDKPPHY